jgi:hypothetical protein
MSRESLASAARAAFVLALLYLSLVTANYLLRNTPEAARARLAKQNVATVEVVRAVYSQAGCLSIDAGDTLYLDHQNCDCASSEPTRPEALAAGG